jgi:magnesium transporter
MKRLTSITIVLSLPALVAGIYGMNVEIPFMHSPHAFYIPVILSLLVSFLLSWYFMKRKWF